jgi:hypothetical protein
MIGLLYLLFLVFYIWLSVRVVRLTSRWARRNGRGPKRWAWTAGIGMYLLLFWDLIPTHATHQYYCATAGGLSVHKTLDQWKAENPGVAETLKPIRNAPWNEMGDRTRVPLNQRFAWDRYEQRHLFGVRERDERIVDTKTGETLARYVDFDTDVLGVERGTASRGLRDYKFWLAVGSCERGDGHRTKPMNFEFNKFMYLVQHQREYR